jgi:hypothetical protein
MNSRSIAGEKEEKRDHGIKDGQKTRVATDRVVLKARLCLRSRLSLLQ